MAMSEETRKQILLGINVDGADGPSKLAAEIAHLQAQVRVTSEDFAKGAGSAQAYAREINELSTKIGRLTKLYDEMTATYTKQELAEAEALAKRVTNYENFVAKQEAAQTKKAARDAIEHERKIDQIASELIKQEQADERQIESAKALEVVRKTQAQDEQRMLRERLAMIQAMKDGVIVMGHNGQALLDEIAATNQATVATGRLAQAKKLGAEEANRWGYGILHISHALQDAQYGFGAVLNNIPLVVQALGGGAGLAGTVMAVGVGLSVAAPHLKEFGAALGVVADATKMTSDSLEGNKEKLKALTEKAWKVQVDYVSIEETTRKIEELEERKRALDATKAPFGSKEVGAHGAEAIRAGGGRDALIGQIQGAIRASGRERAVYDEEDVNKLKFQENLRAELERKRANLPKVDPLLDPVQAAMSGALSLTMGHEITVAKGRAEEIRQKMRTQLEKRAEKLAGGVASGDEKDIAVVGGLVQAAPGAFNPDFAHEFGMMPKTAQEAADLNQAEESRKNRDEAAKKTRAKNKALNNQGAANKFAADQAKAQEEAREIAQQATTLGHALGQDATAGGLNARIAKGFAAGGDNDAVRQQVEAMVTERAKVAGVSDGQLAQVVQSVVSKAIEKVRADAAQHAGNLQEGAKGVAADLAEKADKQQDAAARRPITRAARDKSDAEKARLTEVANDIQAHTGFTPDVAMVAAKDAINRMKHGQDRTTASWAAVQDMLEKLVMMNAEAAGSQALFMQQLQHLEAKIQNVGHQVKGNHRRAQRGINTARPSLLPWQSP